MTENADKRESVHTFRLSFAELTVTVRRVGEDLLVLAEGGDKPHLGCTVLALPRPSLRGDGSVSCTSSVLNRAGHRDEEICRYLAEKCAVKYDTAVVCTGGFHVDGITKEQIAEVLAAVKEAEL
ncbi:MAG: dihydrodipicolinate synthase family protein [Lachnospiraceae bacterium]|nr:dihydrodipicolinate synthase family protein [Lachnospiraceae bacterium]